MKIIRIDGASFMDYLYAKNYVSAVDCLINRGCITADFQFDPLFSGEAKTLKQVLGENWATTIMGWDIKKFNEYFEGCFYLEKVDVWEA